MQAKSQNESLEGNFDGIGIEYYVLNDTLLVTSVKEKGPSAKAGVHKGDRIIAVNGESIIVKDDANKMVDKLRGKNGSMLVRFESGETVNVIGRLLRKIKN